MGAKSGWLTCSAALGGADIVIPPEWEFNLETILNKIKKKYKQNNNLCVIGLSKEAKIKGLAGIADKQIDFFNNKRKEFVSLSLQKKIQSKLGLNTKTIVRPNKLFFPFLLVFRLYVFKNFISANIQGLFFFV